MAAKFIGYCVGLRALRRDSSRLPGIVKVEFSRTLSGSVKLQAVSGRSLAAIPGATVTISDDEYRDRPAEPYNQVPEAEWALNKVGFLICR